MRAKPAKMVSGLDFGGGRPPGMQRSADEFDCKLAQGGEPRSDSTLNRSNCVNRQHEYNCTQFPLGNDVVTCLAEVTTLPLMLLGHALWAE